MTTQRYFALSYLTDREERALEDRPVLRRHYDGVIRGRDAIVFKEGGGPLLVFLRQAIPKWASWRAYHPLRRAAKVTQNRGRATGHAEKVRSGLIGYFERTTRCPYCRVTPFTRDNKNLDWWNVQPLLRACADVYRDALPDAYGEQRRFVELTHPDFVIPHTPFTTATVNRNVRFHAHRDTGNLSVGYSVMTVLARGEYTGGLLVFPRYRVAADVRHRDVILFESNALHGNTALVSDNWFCRLSVVCYYRAKMLYCGSAEEENEFAKRHRHGEPLYP